MLDPVKMNNKHKLVIDAYFKNGFNGTKAYGSIYKAKKANTCAVNFHNIMKREEIIPYYNKKLEEYKETLKLDKDLLIERQMKLDNMFMEYLDLSSRIDLSEDEDKQYQKYWLLFGKVDLGKNRDMLHKLGGYYAPVQTEIDHTVKVEQPLFGELPDKTEESED